MGTEYALEVVVWVFIGLFSGSVPWALLITKMFANSNIRAVGDGNPGTVNAWKSGGWTSGVPSLILEVSKGFMPVYFAIQNLGSPAGIMSQFGFACVAVAPIVGHAWSPFLRFSGGKALATTWGAWIAITGGVAFPVSCGFLILMHILQRNHAITVTFCVLGLVLVFLPLSAEPYVGVFGLANLLIVIYKHKSEYSNGIEPRQWISRFAGRLT